MDLGISMNKDELINRLIRKIEMNRAEAEHYAAKAHEEPESFALWKELQGWYEGRVSAFQCAKDLLEGIS